jgi:ABC-type transporter Mla maintaining outer membrane lipid asymmetry ATPase subunit MlaF
LPLRYHRNLAADDSAAAVHEMMAMMDLEPWADSTPGAIGRPWQKRTGLARALILRPEVLLVDDPLAGLDLRHTNWWLNLLDQLSKGHPVLEGRGLTLVVTAADLRPWRGRAQQFAVLKERRLAVLGDWARLEGEKKWTDGLMN